MKLESFKITEIGPQGDGIHRGPSGQPIFVPKTAPGDRLLGHTYCDAQGIHRAETYRLTQRSTLRQPPPCRHFDQCGNCSLQHLKPDAYLQWKRDRVLGALQKQGLKPSGCEPVLSIPTATRRRTTFTLLRSGARTQLGYYARRDSKLVNVDSCLTVEPSLWQTAQIMRTLLAPALLNQRCVDLFVQTVGTGTEALLTGPLKSVSRLGWEQILDEAGLARIGTRFDYSKSLRIVGQAHPVEATFGALRVSLPPGAFVQPSFAGEKALVDQVKSVVQPNQKWADLFSGCGTFTGHLLEAGASVDAFELSATAVSALAGAAKGHAAQAFERDLFKRPLSAKQLDYDGVVLDPPRAGCARQAQALTPSKVPTVVLVSCNPATFARDAGILCTNGYKFGRLAIVDQFTWSHHVECVGVFQ